MALSHDGLSDKSSEADTKDNKDEKPTIPIVLTLEHIETFYCLICAALSESSPFFDLLMRLRKDLFNFFTMRDVLPLHNRMMVARINFLQNRNFFEKQYAGIVEAIKSDIAKDGALVKKISSVDMSMEAIFEAIANQYTQLDYKAASIVPNKIRAGYELLDNEESPDQDNDNNFKSIRLIALRYNEAGHEKIHANKFRSAFHHYLCGLIILKKIPAGSRLKTDKISIGILQGNVDHALNRFLQHVDGYNNILDLLDYFYSILMMLLYEQEEFARQIAYIEYVISMLQENDIDMHAEIYRSFRVTIVDFFERAEQHCDAKRGVFTWHYVLLSFAVLNKIPKKYQNDDDREWYDHLSVHIADGLRFFVAKENKPIAEIDELIKYMGSVVLILINATEDYSALIIQIQRAMIAWYEQRGDYHFSQGEHDLAIASYQASIRLLDIVRDSDFIERKAIFAGYIAKAYLQKSMHFLTQDNVWGTIRCYQKARKFSVIAQQLSATSAAQLIDIDSPLLFIGAFYKKMDVFLQQQQYDQVIKLCQAAIYCLLLSTSCFRQEIIMNLKRYLIDICCTFADTLSAEEKYADAIDIYQMAKNVFVDRNLSTEEDQKKLETINAALKAMIATKSTLETFSGMPVNSPRATHSLATLWQPQRVVAPPVEEVKAVVEQEWVFTLE